MGAPNSCICVLGWYFDNRAMYASLAKTDKAEIFIISHRPERVVPDWLKKLVDKDHIFYEPNIGYDWGGYQQFLEKGIWKEFDYIFFMHDDISIKDYTFFEECHRLLDTFCVVGNGRLEESPIKPKKNPQRYAHMKIIPRPDEDHYGVRGSFFATKHASLKAIQRFEVFWDRFHISDVFGNHSLVATCYKWQQKCGSKDFCGWLSDSYCQSKWITEFQRGKSFDGRVERGISRISRYTPAYYFKKLMRKAALMIGKKKTQMAWKGAENNDGVYARCERFLSKRK